MSVSEADRILSAHGFPADAIGESIANNGTDRRRGDVDMLRHRYLGFGNREACGALREWRVSADWRDGREKHEATATLAFRWLRDGARRTPWEPIR